MQRFPFPSSVFTTFLYNTSVQHFCQNSQNTCLEDFWTTLLYNTSRRHLSTTPVLYNTSFPKPFLQHLFAAPFQHVSTTLFYNPLPNTALQTLLHNTFLNFFLQPWHFSSAIFTRPLHTPLQHCPRHFSTTLFHTAPCPTLFYYTSRQHFCNTSPQHSSTPLFYTTSVQRSFQHFFEIFPYTSPQHFFQSTTLPKKIDTCLQHSSTTL